MQVDEIILVEAQQNKVLELKEKIDDYLTMSEDYWREFLPSQYDLLIHRKELLINDYYCVVIGEKANEVIEALENALKA